ncbi:MAG: nucleotide exchange factor GrpE [Flavobacteriales bacterium]
MAVNEDKAKQEEEEKQAQSQEGEQDQAKQGSTQKESDKDADQVEEQETENDEQSEASEEEEEASSADERVKQLEKQLEDLNEKHLRLFSEFDNFKKRTKKEKSELIKSAGEDVIGELLPVLDDFERAIASNQEVEAEGEQVEQLKNGFELIYNKMKKTLEDKGLQEMEAEWEEFNTDRHEAMTRMPVEDEEQKGKVVEVVQKGYYLNEKVLRYAKVVVGQ